MRCSSFSMAFLSYRITGMTYCLPTACCPVDLLACSHSCIVIDTRLSILFSVILCSFFLVFRSSAFSFDTIFSSSLLISLLNSVSQLANFSDYCYKITVILAFHFCIFLNSPMWTELLADTNLDNHLDRSLRTTLVTFISRISSAFSSFPLNQS